MTPKPPRGGSASYLRSKPPRGGLGVNWCESPRGGFGVILGYIWCEFCKIFIFFWCAFGVDLV
jgi:hypothetical protein